MSKSIFFAHGLGGRVPRSMFAIICVSSSGICVSGQRALGRSSKLQIKLTAAIIACARQMPYNAVQGTERDMAPYVGRPITITGITHASFGTLYPEFTGTLHAPASATQPTSDTCCGTLQVRHRDSEALCLRSIPHSLNTPRIR